MIDVIRSAEVEFSPHHGTTTESRGCGRALSSHRPRKQPAVDLSRGRGLQEIPLAAVDPKGKARLFSLRLLPDVELLSLAAGAAG